MGQCCATKTNDTHNVDAFHLDKGNSIIRIQAALRAYMQKNKTKSSPTHTNAPTTKLQTDNQRVKVNSYTGN